MRLARGHNASSDPRLLGLKSSTLPPSHCAPTPLLFEENAMYTVMRDKIVYTELLVISFAACFFGFFLCVFLQQIMLTLPRAVAHLSRVIRLPPSMWHFYMNRMQRA